MPRYHLVRSGALSQVGRFVSLDATRFPRGSRVIVRTGRGVEVGEVLAPPGADSRSEPDGSILRGMTVEDQLLEARLHSKRLAAYEACRRRLDELRLGAVLVDVEHLFDGQTLVFYFLGQAPPELQNITAELAAAYDAEAQLGSFAELLSHGCGPGCGTEESTGLGCSTCASGCAIASHCSTAHRSTPA